jgi:prefoldin alpha subunit
MTQQIDIQDLQIPQLQQVKGQIEQELSHLTASFTQLKQAQVQFHDCIDSINKTLQPANEGRTILVPVTASLYVPGEIADTERVLVDIGTGYYIEKSKVDATRFYQDKVDYVKENLVKLQETITGKQNNLRVLLDVLQLKVSQAAAT